MIIKEIKIEDFEKEIDSRKDKRLIAISGVDEGDHLAIYYHFDDKEVENLKFVLPKEGSKLPSIIKYFPSAELYERETHDFFGVKFEGNPNIDKKLFLSDKFKGKPPLLKKEEHYHA